MDAESGNVRPRAHVGAVGRPEDHDDDGDTTMDRLGEREVKTTETARMAAQGLWGGLWAVHDPPVAR